MKSATTIAVMTTRRKKMRTDPQDNLGAGQALLGAGSACIRPVERLASFARKGMSFLRGEARGVAIAVAF